MRSICIVGASLSGVRTAEALREKGFDGGITLIGDEPHLPYDRPPLSKGYLAGKDTRARIDLRAAESYATDAIDVRLSTRVAGAILTAAAVTLSTSSSPVEADALVIASGTRTRSAPFPVDHRSVHEVRHVEDSDRLRPLLVAGARVVVVGAGFIGAEVASTARSLGCSVTVVEAAPIPLSRQLGDQMGLACASLHERNGVTLLPGETVLGVTPEGVALGSGPILAADVVVIGIGVQPNTEWLDGSGLELRDGVCTDPTLRALTISGDSLDNVVAVGDVVRWKNPLFDEEMRIEHWTHAAESAERAASTLLGAREPYAPVPYFWSDQYGRKIQFVGRATGFEEVRVVQGSVEEDSWLALYRRDDRIIAALGVHKMRALMAARKAVLERFAWADALALVG
jgi:NADPH-dependent 2,4-dienoyl-CoA reductase/sulfur reductase-like enzyme